MNIQISFVINWALFEFEWNVPFIQRMHGGILRERHADTLLTPIAIIKKLFPNILSVPLSKIDNS